MAKIIAHNFSEKIRTPKEDLLTNSFHFFINGMEDRKTLIGEMVMQARIFLSQEGMPPGEFIISETYLREILRAPFAKKPITGDDYEEMVYLRSEEDRITALCQFAVPEGEGFTISYQIYKLEHPGAGRPRWQVYNFQSKSWMDDEDDCFDLRIVQKDLELFSREHQE